MTSSKNVCRKPCNRFHRRIVPSARVEVLPMPGEHNESIESPSNMPTISRVNVVLWYPLPLASVVPFGANAKVRN